MKSSINKLIKLIPEWNGKSIKVNPINSGITNINFEVIVDEKSFFLSMPSSNSELLNIDYKNKYYNNKICGEINISPRVTHFIESENLLVTEFVKSKVSSLAMYQSSKEIEQLVVLDLQHHRKGWLGNVDFHLNGRIRQGNGHPLPVIKRDKESQLAVYGFEQILKIKFLTGSRQHLGKLGNHFRRGGIFHEILKPIKAPYHVGIGMEGEDRVGWKQLEHLLLMGLGTQKFPEKALPFLRVMVKHHHVSVETGLERKAARSKTADVTQPALLIYGATHVDGHGHLLTLLFIELFPGEIGKCSDGIQVAVKLGKHLLGAEVEIKTTA